MITVIISNKYKVDLKNTFVVADGENDICYLKKSRDQRIFLRSCSILDAVYDYVERNRILNY